MAALAIRDCQVSGRFACKSGNAEQRPTVRSSMVRKGSSVRVRLRASAPRARHVATRVAEGGDGAFVGEPQSRPLSVDDADLCRLFGLRIGTRPDRIRVVVVILAFLIDVASYGEGRG